jgi:hypothetical protein
MRRNPNDWYVTVAVWGAIAVVIAVAYFVSRYRNRKRTEALQQIADELGLQFFPDGNGALLMSLRHFGLISSGGNQKILNLMRGMSEDREVAVFDFEYVTGSGKSRRTWRTTVVCLRSDGFEFPTFSLRPQNFWNKVGRWFGGSAIDFESHPTFSKNYLLRGDNEALIRDIFDADALDFYEQHPGVTVEGSGNTLLVYRHRVKIAPAELPAFLAEGFRILALHRS